jgi:exopolysaccharide/PEP-CTERM locus tyrosine autokinase
MSRIESALEKAALLRSTGGSGIAVVKQEVNLHNSSARPSVPPPPMVCGELPARIDNPVIATLDDPLSPISEEYRKLKSAVVAYSKQSEFRNVIMVTSSLGNEGKSITSLNLAISMAQELDHTVLLVDADIRNPSIHNYLGLDPKNGLSDYLSGDALLADLLVKTGIGRLTLLPAGTPLRNPVELCSSQRMKEFIDEIKNRYPDRFIIIDTPPVLPFAETRFLGALSDGIVFVIREGSATPENIEEALNALGADKLIGAVYNDATAQCLNGHYHYYYHGYGYAQGTTDGTAEVTEEKRQKGGLFRRFFRRVGTAEPESKTTKA